MIEENERLNAEAKAEITHITYGLGKHTLFMKFYPKTMDRWRNHKFVFNMILCVYISAVSSANFDCVFTEFSGIYYTKILI